MTTSGTELAFGLVTGADLKRVAALEQLPIDSLWTGGHVASPNPSTEAMMSLARLSAVTERVHIGTSILLLPLYSPAIVAKQIADMDRATGGRIILGVGVGGEYPQEFRACQIPLQERGRRVDEAIPLMRRLWTAEEISHHGTYYAMENVRVHPPPTQSGGPPIVVAGRRQPAMRRAALLGDGWMPYLYSPRRYAASADAIRRLAADTGRDLSDFGWYAFIFVNIHTDGARAREAAARALGGQYHQDFQAIVDHVAAAGTPQEVSHKLIEFVDAGARHFILSPAAAGDDPDRVIQCLVQEVIPTVRERSGVGRP